MTTLSEKDGPAQIHEWQARLASESLCKLVESADFIDVAKVSDIAVALVDGLLAINSRTLTG